MNVSHLAKAFHIGRVYLGIVLPSGRVVTNKTCTPPDAPDDTDSDSPWHHAGARYSHTAETGATYFLSPLPPPDETVTLTISYPRIGIDPATIPLDTTILIARA
ncbi:hypothetical protein [Rhodococcus sp. HNM0569]|uniref:hypothetical protein n=1 Tax=Rhodococcus sp. HNM0569 TaxID=2716340 RepID=UPI00146D88F3|nr:hypothetical protein [Rhodococcus sp. HNM0569]NLU82689.1 hypothetical protein [Rhodococcus sp. HNM0569]